jgi:glycosyltransferase involved in cell wall biosynthesis
MHAPPCICIFTGYYQPHFGGVERYAASFARHLSGKGFSVILVTSNSENVIDEEIIDKVKIIRLPVFGLFKVRYPLLNIFNNRYRQQVNFLRNEKIDYFILNTRFYLTTFLGLRLAAKKRKKCLIIEHGTGHLITNNPVVNLLAALYEHLLTKYVKKSDPWFFGVSRASTQWLNHFDISTREVIYNGTEMGKIDPQTRFFRSKYQIPENHVVVSMASRLIPEKGVLEGMEAFEKISLTHASVHFFLAGDGPLRDVLIDRYSTHPRIHILGRLDYHEVMILFDETDIVVNPSHYPEGLPTVILEAGMANCAVIATNKGGSPEIIPDRDYGIIVSGYDAKCFTEAIAELCDDAELRKNMAINLQRRVKENFTWERIIDHFILTLGRFNPN